MKEVAALFSLGSHYYYAFIDLGWELILDLVFLSGPLVK